MPSAFKSRLAAGVAGSCALALLAMGSSSAGSTLVTAPEAPAVGSSVLALTEGVRVDRSTSIVATTPPQVTLGERIVVRGTVRVLAGAKARPRVVRLSEKIGTEAKILAQKKSTRTGSFVFQKPAGTKAKTRTFVVSAPRVGALSAARTTLKVKVVRAFVEPPEDAEPEYPEPTIPSSGFDPEEPVDATLPAPLGLSTDWTYLFDGGGRWDPCEVIDWGYDPEGSYPGSLEDMKRTFAKISGYTGLKFKYRGLKGEDFNITWATEAEDPQLGGWTVGYAGSWGSWTPDGADVAYRLFDGFMVLDEEAALRPGFDVSGSSTWGQVMLHETLHALGLGHADGQEQVMYGAVTSVNHLFGAGDVTGMTTKINAQRGCL